MHGVRCKTRILDNPTPFSTHSLLWLHLYPQCVPHSHVVSIWSTIHLRLQNPQVPSNDPLPPSSVWITPLELVQAARPSTAIPQPNGAQLHTSFHPVVWKVGFPQLKKKNNKKRTIPKSNKREALMSENLGNARSSKLIADHHCASTRSEENPVLVPFCLL